VREEIVGTLPNIQFIVFRNVISGLSVRLGGWPPYYQVTVKFSSAWRSGTSAISVPVSMGFPSQSPFYHCNSFPVPNHEDLDGGWNISPLFLTLTFVTTGTAQLSALRAGRHLPQEIPWYPLLWEFEYADKWNRSLENFQESNWESNPELQHVLFHAQLTRAPWEAL